MLTVVVPFFLVATRLEELMPTDPNEIRQWAAQWVRSEIARLNGVLESLESGQVKRRGRPAKAVEAVVEQPAPRKRRKMSPEARQRMSEMMKARWAARRPRSRAKRA